MGNVLLKWLLLLLLKMIVSVTVGVTVIINRFQIYGSDTVVIILSATRLYHISS